MKIQVKRTDGFTTFFYNEKQLELLTIVQAISKEVNTALKASYVDPDQHADYEVNLVLGQENFILNSQSISSFNSWSSEIEEYTYDTNLGEMDKETAEQFLKEVKELIETFNADVLKDNFDVEIEI